MFATSDLSNFYGSENLFFDRMFSKIKYTDGVKFLSGNGAGWLVSDALVILHMEKKVIREDFVCIKVKRTPSGATIRYTDGNEKKLFQQDYDGCDLPCDLTLYRENGVLMLSSER